MMRDPDDAEAQLDAPQQSIVEIQEEAAEDGDPIDVPDR
jgi:hypothetical protein